MLSYEELKWVTPVFTVSTRPLTRISAPLPLLIWEVQRRSVRSGRHGAPADRHRRLLGGGFSLANLPGGGGSTALPRSPSSHAAGGGGARRTKREERGRRGGGPGAKGPRPGLGRAEAKGRNRRPPIGGASVLLDARWDWPDR